MSSMPEPYPLHQHCLGYLQKILDLAMHTAETASAEGNHKIVLQAVREVTRIVTLMTKLDGASGQAPAPVKTKKPVQPAQDSDIAELNSLVQDMLKIFPDLADTPTTAGQKLPIANQFLKSGKKAENYREKTFAEQNII